MTNIDPLGQNTPVENGSGYYKNNFLLKIEELGFNLNGQEILAQEVLDGTLDWILQYTGLNTQFEKIEYLDGLGRERLMLAEYPCQVLLECSVQSYKANNPLQGWQDVTPSVHLLEHGEIIMYPTNIYHWSFPSGTRNIRVRYVCGLTKIPPLLRLTVIELTQALLLRMGIIGAIGIDSNPSADLAKNQSSDPTADQTKGIKKVAVKNLSVEFADDKRTTQDMMNNIAVKKAAYSKMLDDLMREKPSYLTRLNQISKIYMT